MDLWDGEVLVDAPEVIGFLREQLCREPLLAALSETRYEQRTTGDVGTFFRAVWAPTGESVIVKLNASAIVLDWMRVVSRRAPGLVPHVYASGRRLGDVDVGWLVLRRAPHHFDSGSYDDCRELMLATAHFQQVALDIDAMTYPPIDAAFFEWYMPEAIKADCPGPGDDVLARLHQDVRPVLGSRSAISSFPSGWFGSTSGLRTPSWSVLGGRRAVLKRPACQSRAGCRGAAARPAICLLAAA